MKICAIPDSKSKDKIQGMFLGIAIGDAIGKCAEGMGYEDIIKAYGWINCYRRPKKYWKKSPVGGWTDDTQLSLAVADALLDAGEFDMRAIAKHHVKAYNDTTRGWGGSTRDAVKKLKDGSHWDVSGLSDKEFKRSGNGITMKIAPLAAYGFLIRHMRMHNIVTLSKMTHASRLAIQSGILHNYAVYYCLNSDSTKFNKFRFLAYLTKKLNEFEAKYGVIPDIDENDGYNMADQMKKLLLYKMYTTDDAREEFGEGSCFVYHSLPFAYYFFLRATTTFASVLTATNAGGDTDTNASMVGSLIGALNGTEVFPKHLVNKLSEKDRIIDTANRFWEAFSLS